MQDLLAQGAAWLAQQRRKHCAQKVAYSRPSTGSTLRKVPATRGRSLHQIEQGDGALVSVESDDFIIAPGDLKLDGVESEPAAGDRITDADGYVYEVAPPIGGGGEPHWRWADGHRQDLRIHVKQITTPA